MRNFCLSLILIILLPSVYFSSCSKEDDEKEKPIISNVRFNVNDTLINEGKRIKLNDSLAIHEADTLVIGKWIYVNAKFQDNEALSTYSVTLDSLKGTVQVEDSLHFHFVKLGTNIFGKRDTVISRNYLIQIPHYTTRTNKLTAKTDTFHTREGIYNMKVRCIDKVGNMDSVIRPVRVLRRGTLLKN